MLEHILNSSFLHQFIYFSSPFGCPSCACECIYSVRFSFPIYCYSSNELVFFVLLCNLQLQAHPHMYSYFSLLSSPKPRSLARVNGEKLAYPQKYDIFHLFSPLFQFTKNSAICNCNWTYFHSPVFFGSSILFSNVSFLFHLKCERWRKSNKIACSNQWQLHIAIRFLQIAKQK